MANIVIIMVMKWDIFVAFARVPLSIFCVTNVIQDVIGIYFMNVNFGLHISKQNVVADNARVALPLDYTYHWLEFLVIDLRRIRQFVVTLLKGVP